MYLDNIEISQFETILNWYNDLDDTFFATGLEKSIVMNELCDIYKEISNVSKSFLNGIYLDNSKSVIGVIKWHLNVNNKNIAWINQIIIDKKYRRCGYGSTSMILLFKFLKSQYEIQEILLSVAKENYIGLYFWESLDFKVFKRIEKNLKLKENLKDVLILKRNLTK